MRPNEGSSSDDEFFDCPIDDKRNNVNIKFCAVASPRALGRGRVFTDEAKAFSKLRGSKGSRLKIFADPVEACGFANTPVEDLEKLEIYPPSPKADTESTPFSSVTLQTIFDFRLFIEKGDKNSVQSIINDNPLILISLNDTPVMLQTRFRYNALHIAAKAGVKDVMDLILNELNSNVLWKRIYPTASNENSLNRQLYVTDLYLNSPETGSLETPLHFASKYGHLDCVRLLVGHPLTQICPMNSSGATPSDIAATRWQPKANEPNADLDMAELIRTVFRERYLILVDLQNPRTKLERFGVISSPLSTRQLQIILSRYIPKSCSTFARLTSITILPFDQILGYLASPTCQIFELGDQPPLLLADSSLNLGYFGLPGEITRVRAIVGPLTPEQAATFKNHWSSAKKTTCYPKPFYSIRLMDPEKGYERQGRYLAQVFHTQWFEYWEFADDFMDLSTEPGLNAFENYLAKSASQTNMHVPSSPSRTPTISSNQMLPSSPLFSAVDMDQSPQTPISRQKNRTDKTTINGQLRDCSDKWTALRPYKSSAHVLEDSLEEQNGTPDRSAHIESSPDSGSSPIMNILTSPISPVIRLLKRLTVVYPLRWVYPTQEAGSQPNTPELDKQNKSIKRKLTTADQQPSSSSPPKRPSPNKTQNFKPELLRHYVHIYRALPGGDHDLVQPDSKHFDASKFPHSYEWYKQVQLVVQHTYQR